KRQPHNELISQLKKITQLKNFKYKDFYLIFVIAFRSILEDISKRYLNTRNLNLHGSLGENIKFMTDDMVSIVRKEDFIDKIDKQKIENIFGGWYSFKNSLETIGNDFYIDGKPGSKATKLNSFLHIPRFMEIEEAENISNDIILPLIVASQEILKRKKK
ncbi:hypothetical protein, partial [Clostridium botulinum]|uniref:hypothetical protein n=1 Tax=Clostridium botulinum TaxID=1491 RepID=UPI001E59AFCC